MQQLEKPREMASYMNTKDQLLERLGEGLNKARIAPLKIRSVQVDSCIKFKIHDGLKSVCGRHLHKIVVRFKTIIDDDISSHCPPSVVQRYNVAGTFALAQQTIAELIHAMLNEP